MDILLLFFLVLKSDKHLCLALMAWVLLSGCAYERESVARPLIRARMHRKHVTTITFVLEVL